MGNASAKSGSNTYTNKVSFANSLAVFNHLQYNINKIKYVMINNLTTIDQKLRIDLAYNFADAFTEEAHPLLAGTRGRMIALSYDDLGEVFAKLTGIGLPGQVQGIFTGPMVVGTGQIVFPANALIEMTLAETVVVFRDINKVLENLILKANVKNILVLMKYPVLTDVITTPADKQEDKKAYVTDLKSKGLL